MTGVQTCALPILSKHNLGYDNYKSAFSLFNLVQLRSVQFGLFRSISVYSVQLGPFGQFCSIRSILSTSVYSGPIRSIRSFSVHFGLLNPFGPIHLIIWSIWSTSVHFSLPQSDPSTSVHWVHLGSLQPNSV